MNVDLGQKKIAQLLHQLLGQLQEEGKTRMQNEQNCPYLGIRSDVMMMMMMMIKGGGVYDNDDKGGGVYNNDDDDKDNDVGRVRVFIQK